jgi:hypothetical protein
MARPSGAAPQQANPADVNMAARNAVLGSAIKMTQQIFSTTLAGTAAGQVINVQPRNVGLITGFVIKVTANVAQSAAETQTLTTLGLANIFSNVTFTDLSNQQRINTTGWHLHMLASARRQSVFGAAFTNDSPNFGVHATPSNFGSNFTVIYAAGTLTTVVPVSMYYEIPLAYSDFDLRGAVYASVVSATMNLQLTVNPTFGVASTANPTNAVYISSTTALPLVTSVVITVYQQYLDQLPMGKNGVILPILDLSTAYLLNNTTVTGLVANQDLPIPYANFRNFMSTCLIYDNAGVLNIGTDMNYFALQSANYTNIFKYDPQTSALFTREIMLDDFPKGCYYFDHRRRPISTVQYGNMSLVANPSAVTAGASVYLGYEALALINMVTQAGSLYGT